MLQYNKWDKEMTDLMIASENKCRKIKTNSLSWSPVIGTYLCHLNIYRWIVRHKKGHKTNVGNLQRACLRNGIADPSQMTQQEAELGELACLKKLKDLEAEAPQRRLEHLECCLDKARSQRDERKEAAIARILKREYDQKRYRKLKVAFG